MTPRRTATLVLLGALVAGAAGGAWWLGRTEPAPRYRTTTVTRTDVRALVSATGTVEAVTTVEVGTQVSGIVSALAVDFNTRVHAGDVLARIDPTLPEADVAAADARLASARAGERRSALDLARITSLHDQAAATDQELETARATHAVDAAEVQAAEVALGRARRNLAYTTITAPIDGTVVRRSVDVGQTVNAGFSAPTLFVLVGDLTRVRVIANVDEADIGRIAAGQAVEVSVAAWPDHPFAGTVGEVRLDSVVEDNVVTYPVVVEVENPDGKLLPGMTATVDFVAESARDVLCVSNAALRWRPAETSRDGSEAGTSSGGAPGGTGGGGGSGSGGRDGGRGRRSGNAGTLWTLPGTEPVSLVVTTGIRGATCTEVSGEGVREGLPVVVGVEATETGGSSPFGTPAATGGFRGGGF